MSDEHWPAIKVDRFHDESQEEFQARRDEIVAIIQAFRRGRYQGVEGDLMEARLLGLQDGILAPNPVPARQPVKSVRSTEPMHA
jgi:hypothetical protein